MLTTDTIAAIRAAVNEDRLLETATALVNVPSPTCSAGACADQLAEILTADGFAVERVVADWPEAPAVVVRYDTGKPGRTLQFDGHLDTVHLPFVPARVEAGVLYGSGAADMKGGIAAFVEALRALRATQALAGGPVLLTAHDHHEGPWGDRRQVYAFMRDGVVGDGVLLPEYLADRLPVAGRGMAIFKITVTRPGAPSHEVLRPPDTPDVIQAGAAVVQQLQLLHERVKGTIHPYAGHDSTFVGNIQAGEIYNQSPTECIIQGTRRWVTPGQGDQVETEMRALLATVAAQTNTQIAVEFHRQGEAFAIDQEHPLVGAFQ
ncbi:MAG: M20/M25/M40 family metallo-hydrolase, partial [Caldilineaceae bacterium]|nr:M20/M25/M40 family metallo-hydrolase [Caldilineaceae bacterium]